MVEGFGSSRVRKEVPKLIHVTTVPLSLWTFFEGQLAQMERWGLDVHAVSSSGELLDRLGARESIDTHAIDMTRRMSPFHDLLATIRLTRLMRALRPTIVHASTPKGGLLGMLSASICRVPVRIYHIHGLRSATETGYRRWLIDLSERISFLLAHRVITVSNSLRDEIIANGLCAPSKIRVPLNGSANGVDARDRFNPTRITPALREDIRKDFRISDSAQVIGFVGRIVRDKGLIELAEAWEELRVEFPDLHLLLVGPFEPQDPLPDRLVAAFREDPRVHLMGLVYDPVPAYAAMDVFVLPSYREGLGNVLLEASAMGLPVVATKIPGCVDAVRDGTTGRLVPPRDAQSLASALRSYIRDSELRRRHGVAGREWMLREFDPAAIWEAVFDEYLDLMRQKGLKAELEALEGARDVVTLD